jgi:tetratricopeptide (TPR) repeat protein
VRLTAAIARQLLLTGNIDPATDLFNEARTTAAGLATPIDRLQAAAAVALEVANARQPVDPAMLDLVRRSAVEINDFSTSSYYLWSLVEQTVSLRHFDLALQLALATPDPDRREMSLGTVAEAALRDGHTDQVLKVIDQSRTPEIRVGLLLSLVERARQDGQPQEAIAYLARALELARTIPDPEIRTFTFGNEGGTVVDDDRDRASAYEAIAIHYAQLARQAEALRVAGLIQHPQERDRVRRRVLCYGTRT